MVVMPFLDAVSAVPVHEERREFFARCGDVASPGNLNAALFRIAQVYNRFNRSLKKGEVCKLRNKVERMRSEAMFLPGSSAPGGSLKTASAFRAGKNSDSSFECGAAA